ncbi:MAG: hypothetical protein ACM308_00060 [Qipengyuania vulgaris]
MRYAGAIGLYFANSVRDCEALKLAEGGNLTRRGLDPDTLLVTNILFVVGMMLLLMFMVAPLRIGFVRYLLAAAVLSQGWELSQVRTEEHGSSVIVGVASVALQAVEVVFTFLPGSNRWFAGTDLATADDS